MNNGLIFTLVPGPGEPLPADLEYQQDRLTQLPLRPRSGSPPIRVRVPGGTYGTRAGAGPLAGPDLGSLLSFAGKALPTLGTALVAWLGGRYGRKVRVKVGEVEVEANTVADIKDLLSRVEQMQKVDKSLPPSPEEHSR